MMLLRLIILTTAIGFCQSCVHTPTELAGENEYIITVALPENQSGVLPSTSVKVYSSAYRWDIPLSVRKAVRTLRRDYEFTVIDTWPLRSIDEYCIVVRAGDDGVKRLQQDPRVASLQPINYFVTMKSKPPYNDGKLEAQLGHNVESLNRLHEWSTGKDVRVGIVDTAVDVDHPDLKDRVQHQEVFVSRELEANDLIHGTAVAGIIGAEANNGVGVVGFAPDVALRSYAACYHHEVRDTSVCNTFALAKALESAADDGLHLINMSLAGPKDRLLTRLIDALIDEGTIVIAADNPDDSTLRFPASMKRVIAASRLDDKRQISTRLIKAEDEHLTTRAGGTYQFFYGSSMSAARVTALTSLFLERNPGMNERMTRQSLTHVIENCHTIPTGAESACTMKFALTGRRVAITGRE